MKFLSLCFALLSLFVFSNTLYGDGQSDFNFGIHAGVGTDINLGIGYGGRFSFMPFGTSGTPIEVGAELFISHSEETTTEGIHDYDETTDLVVFYYPHDFLRSPYSYSRSFYSNAL